MIKTVFLDDKQIKGLSILARMHADELKLAEENPVLIDLYEGAITQLAKAN
ncbi:MAG TPA: hypothetical protein VGF75_05100 [Candidatus Saccharimonadales bacterium]|jgi:hypothetical protein